MKIHFGITGSGRKALVTAVSEITGEKAVYQGAPGFAYKVGDYHIDREGTVMGPDSQGFLDALAERGYADPESGIAYQLDEVNTPPMAIHVPELMGQRNPEHDYAADFPVSAAQVIPEVDDLVIEYPREGFGEKEIANLERLIASKASLLKKSLDADSLPVIQTDTTLQFPWFMTTGTAEESEAYARLVAGLCQAAKKQKRVTARETLVDNEKYAFRVFLNRIGFIGEDCKAARRILLRNLSGNSAFKAGRPPKAKEVRKDA